MNEPHYQVGSFHSLVVMMMAVKKTMEIMMVYPIISIIIMITIITITIIITTNE